MSLLYNRLMKITNVSLVQRGKWTGVSFSSDSFLKNEIQDWCYKQYGNPNNWGKNPNGKWNDYLNWYELSFLHERDVTLFLMRWA